MDCRRCDKVIPQDGLSIARMNTGFEYIVSHTTCVSADAWMSLEDYLVDSQKEDGWQTADNEDDQLKHFILNRIIYSKQEKPEKERDECEFDEPDPQDIVRLLWHKKKPVAFYTIKPKGSHIEGRNEYYALPTLDTAFVRRSSRGKGNGTKILEDLIENFSHGDIGFSSPISQPMLRVYWPGRTWSALLMIPSGKKPRSKDIYERLHGVSRSGENCLLHQAIEQSNEKILNSFLAKHPQHKHRLWQISGGGCEGQRKLIWFVLAKLRRSTKHTG